MFRRRLCSAVYCSVLSLVVVVFATVQGAFAQTYPARPVHVVAPFPSGSGSDVIARLAFDRMSQQVGQQFIVDNRPGAGGMVGTRAATMVPADGYTLLFSASGPLATNKALMTNLPYDLARDFAPVSKLSVGQWEPRLSVLLAAMTKGARS